jgi:hypothetical protein
MLECPKFENIDIFYRHFEYLTDIWDILWPFGTFRVHLVHFFRFWYHVPTKIWQPCAKRPKALKPLVQTIRSYRKLGRFKGKLKCFCCVKRSSLNSFWRGICKLVT